MNELYEELYYLVCSCTDQSEATLAALHDVALDLNTEIQFQSCTRCRAMCDPEHGACQCPLTYWEEEDDYEGTYRRCSICRYLFDQDLHGSWCPHCHGLPIEDAPEDDESPAQVVPNEEPQQFPMTEDDDIPF